MLIRNTIEYIKLYNIYSMVILLKYCVRVSLIVLGRTKKYISLIVIYDVSDDHT